MGSLTKNEKRVADLLTKRGRLGITVLDFAAGFRVAARIFDLRARGWEIVSRPKQLEGGSRITRYVLIKKKRKDDGT